MVQNKKVFMGNTNRLSVVLKVLTIALLLLILICAIKTCRECDCNRLVTETGYLPEYENWDNIPHVIPPYDEEDLERLPDKVSLEAFFPPIGNQGDKGTCVAWAVGYNLKTALNAIANHWTQEQLENPANQTSPKDLFLAIPSEQKGEGCYGTTFESAFSVLMSDGVATMQVVPYENLGDCNGMTIGDSSNKIANFGHVVSETDKPDVEQLKAYLNDTVPLVFCAKLGDRFRGWWNNDRIIDFDTYNTEWSMHSYHAMVLSGYDDSRHAFRVRNSWGTEWGDEGSIWVDYDFFCNSFCLDVFVAQNSGEVVENE